MEKICKHCKVVLTKENRAQERLECKPCRSKKVCAFQKTIPDYRRKYATDWLRKTGRVKQYPCETCKKLCYKKYALAFCSDECRLLNYVVKIDQCWMWKAGKGRRGYGKSSLGNKIMPAHRVSFILFRGPIEKGKSILHSCHQPSCINPDHLRMGTTKDNSLDMINAGRSLRGENQPIAKLTSAQILEIRKLNETMTQYKIAEMFDVTAGHLNNIVKRRVWKHI